MYKVIKKCPFCGGEAEFVTDTNGYQSGCRSISFHIECEDCKIQYPKRYEIKLSLGKHGEIITNTDERNVALEAWNRRTCSCKKQGES